MLPNRSRPTSKHGAQPHMLPPLAHPPRKIFNCIVEDTALVAGVKKSTRSGIRQWVKNGQIRLFVPLHALEQLRRHAGSQSRHGEDVRETLQWLDDATSRYPHAITLQGGDQYYQNWAEVERFAVPRTLFSEDDHVEDHEPEPEVDGLPDERTTKLTLSDPPRKSSMSSAGSVMSEPASVSSTESMRSSASPVSPPTSPTKATSSPVKPLASLDSTSRLTSSSASVPLRLQSLFNYILWRIHQELDPVAALESFIFLCNDANKAKHVKGFDIRTKRLDQLREAVGREDRDVPNRQQMQTRENQTTSSVNAPPPLADADDEVVFKPKTPKAPAGMLREPQPPNLIDPNAFGRTSQAIAQPVPFVAPPRSPRIQQTFAQNSAGRGGPAGPFAPRGNMRGNFRGVQRGRGNFNPGRGGFANVTNLPATQLGGQIDPDSFARPRGAGYTGRGGRKLWMPT